MAASKVEHRAQRLELTVMPEKDFLRPFFRCTVADEVHNGYQWKDGLNVDPRQFSTKVECGPGGLYFTDLHHIDDWLGGARWVREVVPVLDKGEFARVQLVKWKAHAVTAGPRHDLDELGTWKYLLHKAAAHGVGNRGILFRMFERMSVSRGGELSKALASDMGVAPAIRLCWMSCCQSTVDPAIVRSFCNHLAPHLTNRDLADSYNRLAYFSGERFFELLYGWWPRFKRIFYHKPLPRTSTNTLDNWLSGQVYRA